MDRYSAGSALSADPIVGYGTRRTDRCGVLREIPDRRSVQVLPSGASVARRGLLPAVRQSKSLQANVPGATMAMRRVFAGRLSLLPPRRHILQEYE